MPGFFAPLVRTLRGGIGTALLVLILSLTACGKRSAPPITSINDEPLPPGEGPRQGQNIFAVAAERVRPALVVLATFDEHGGLVANEYAFFISANGDLLAEKSAMNNAASAMAKSADGHVFDIHGTYLRSTAPNFIVLKTRARNVPHLNTGAAATIPDGARAAVVLAANTQPSLMEGRISGRKVDATGEWLTFSPDLPKTTVGAPAIDEKGGLIGVVAQRGDRGAPAIFHASAGAKAVVAQIAPEPIPTPEITPENAIAEMTSPPQMTKRPKAASDKESTPPPIAESQRAAEVDLSRAQPEQINPEITPRGFFIRMNPNWHIHARDRPHAAQAGTNSTADDRSGKLVYTPAPRYPTKRLGSSSTSGSGSYRLTFDDQGKVIDVDIVRSAGWSSLDAAAISTLRSWRAEGGRAWTVVVPVTFK